MRRFACLRGSSDDDHPERCRSTQSTPRMHRYKVRDVSRDSQRSCNSITSMEAHRNHRNRESSSDRERDRIKLLNRSWDAVENERVHCDRHRERTPPRGLDRAWETERTRGLELMYRSLEKEKERRSHKDKDRIRDRHSEKGRDKHGKRDKSEMSKEFLEKRVEELTHLLQEEKQHSRKDKLTVAKLQRELARNKSEGPVRESLMRELERERMLRVDAENRLKEITVENDACKSRLQALQDDFKKMDDMVRGLMQYKNKLDQLKQEKAKLTSTYENTIQKYKTHLGNLEQDNQLLLAEVKKIESQCANCQICNKDLSYRVSNKENGNVEDKERMKVLMQRLKQLEAENSALVLESEQQRGQYDKCLDEIANQVVQALLSQKSLREECMKLQKRVLDLETHNQQLAQMFQNRFRFSSDSLLQTYMHRGAGTNLGDRSPQSTEGSSNSLPVHTQKSVITRAPGDRTGNADESFDSLQSICSDYDDHVLYEENLGRPEMSSPPAWLRDRIFSSGSPNSKQGESTSSLDLKIHTLFPATNTSPKVTHITQSRHEASAFELVKPIDNVNKNNKKQSRVSHQAGTEYSPDKVKEETMSEIACVVSKETSLADVKRQPGGTSWMKPEKPTYLSPQVKKEFDTPNKEFDVSPGKELLKLSDSFDEKYMISDNDGLPCIKRRNLTLDSSSEDEEARSRPVSNMLGSAISLNELLEKELKDVITPTDDEYTDNFLSHTQEQTTKRKQNESHVVSSSDKKSKVDSRTLAKDQSHSLPSIANDPPKASNYSAELRSPPITGSGDIGQVFGLLRSGSGYSSFPMLDQYNEKINHSVLQNKADKPTPEKNVEVAETDSERSTSTVSQRSTLSPDSMHQSFTSSGSSDHVLSDKPHRDDGYSSMSMSSSDTHLSTSGKTKLKMPSVEETMLTVMSCGENDGKNTPACNASERHPKRLFGVSLSKSNSILDSLSGSPDKTLSLQSSHSSFKGKSSCSRLSERRSSSHSVDVMDKYGAPSKDALLNGHNPGAYKQSTENRVTSQSEPYLLDFLSRNRLRWKFHKYWAARNSPQNMLRRTLSDSDITQFDALAADLHEKKLDKTLSLSCEHLAEELYIPEQSETMSPDSTETDHSTNDSVPSGPEAVDAQADITERLSVADEEENSQTNEVYVVSSGGQLKTTVPHRDYVNLSWLRNGQETSVHVCDNDQDEPTNCNQHEPHTDNIPNTQDIPVHLHNGNNTTSRLPKASSGKVHTNGTYIYQKGGKSSLPRNTTTEGHICNGVTDNTDSLSYRSKPHNKFLDCVRTQERMNNRMSNSSIDSQASFETLSDTCCEEYATNSEED